MKTKERGILAVGILLTMLTIAVGSVSATNITECTVITSPGTYNITANITNSTATYCINIQSDNVILDGQGHWVDGVSPGNCVPPRAGIYNYQHDNVEIKNVEVKNFCFGIWLKGYYSDPTDFDYVVNNTIDNCKVHDNGNPNSGATHGIELFAASHCNVTNNEVYNNTGAGAGCGRGGMGIRMHGTDHPSLWAGYHNVTNNTVYGNRIAGIYSKKKSKYNCVAYNDVYKNGEVTGGSYFGGGIRLQCMMTNYWTVEHNNVRDNYGPGIYVRGDNNVIRYNNETGSKNASNVASGTGVGVGYGIYFAIEGSNNNITANRFCYNEGKDIYDDDNTFGDENTCDCTHNYDDTGTTGCTYRCMHAYGYQLLYPDAPGTNTEPSIEFSATQYASIEADDGVFASNQTDQEDYYAVHRFNFSVIADPSTITKINVTWNGKGWHDAGGNCNGTSLYIYRGDAEAAPVDTTNSGAEVYLTGEKTSGISNYIYSGNVTVFAVQKSADTVRRHSHIETDCVKLVITVTT
ncbi:MAG TPA: hypothetical protein C5S37_01675 [Methanophagales archaeon]|nr:hypothetical protein [Methanophagales archaeon]